MKIVRHIKKVKEGKTTLYFEEPMITLDHCLRVDFAYF